MHAQTLTFENEGYDNRASSSLQHTGPAARQLRNSKPRATSPGSIKCMMPPGAALRSDGKVHWLIGTAKRFASRSLSKMSNPAGSSGARNTSPPSSTTVASRCPAKDSRMSAFGTKGTSGATRRGIPRTKQRNLQVAFLLVRTGFAELIEHRQDILKIFRVLVGVVQRVEQGEVFGTQLFL